MLFAFANDCFLGGVEAVGFIMGGGVCWGDCFSLRSYRWAFFFFLIIRSLLSFFSFVVNSRK